VAEIEAVASELEAVGLVAGFVAGLVAGFVAGLVEAELEAVAAKLEAVVAEIEAVASELEAVGLVAGLQNSGENFYSSSCLHFSEMTDRMSHPA
jgi:hypothetical protein